MKRIIKYCVVAGAVVLALHMAGCKDGAADDEDPVTAVTTVPSGENHVIEGAYDTTFAAQAANGTFVGRQEEDVLCFRGIPYAVQPTGERRWKVAEPEPDSYLVREAYYYGHASLQPRSSETLYPQGEDCLTLNVWTAREGWRDAHRPVMVWIHGGSYCVGCTADSMYDGTAFVQAHPDVVLVTVNYRLGLLGFLDLSSLPDGKDYPNSANLGLMDQIEALRWVKRNIAAWGGDPNNVTIFGQSAGAGSVTLLACIDQAQGLFNRVIAQSGSVALSSSREECQQLTRRILDETGAKTVADLVALDDKQMTALTRKLGAYCRFPMRDGELIPLDPYACFDGHNAMVDFMIGTTRDETHMWIDAMGGVRQYQAATQLWAHYIRYQLDSAGKQLIDNYMATVPVPRGWKSAQLLSDLMFRGPAIEMAQRHAAAGGNTYMYSWNKPLRHPDYGACHASENPYVFNHPDCKVKMGDEYNDELAHQVQQMWVNFATTGDPGTMEHEWPAYDTTRRVTMMLGDTIGLAQDPMPDQRRQMQPLMKHYVSPVFSDLLDKIPWLIGVVGVTAVAAILLLIAIARRIRRSRRRHRTT